MLQIFVIIFRETLEITLILGLILAATDNLKQRKFPVALGGGLGIAGSVILAFFTSAIAQSFDGIGQDYFNAGLVLTVSILLIWTLVWMQSSNKNLFNKLKDKNGVPSFTTLTILIAATIFREGSEVVLFTYGAYTAHNIANTTLLMGVVVGVLSGFILGFALYKGVFSFGTKRAFQISSFLLTFIAAGMAAQAIKFLNSGGAIYILSDPLWDSSNFIREDTLLGQVVSVLFGYSAHPNALQLIVYMSVIYIVYAIKRYRLNSKSV